MQFEDNLKEVALPFTLRCVGLMWSCNITQQMEELNFLFLASHMGLHRSSLQEKKLTSNAAGMISE